MVFFASLQAQIIPEDITNHGQTDLIVKVGGCIYVIEIKLDRNDVDSSVKGAVNPALQQIQERGYAEKYKGQPGKGLFEVGLVFNSKVRNLIIAD